MFKKLLKDSFFPSFIITITGFIAWVNYIPATILSGWDSLHLEFNLSLYLKRIFFGVWQEHQGVGAVASQSHTAELTRMPVLWFESLFLPIELIRYVFVFICLGIGALGIYFFLNYLLNKYSEKMAGTSAFIASVFYMLNLTTVQQFSVPLEMFTVHFAVVPWLFYLVVKYLREGGKKNILWFAVVTLFSSSMAHTATLYYVYIVILGLFLFSVWIVHRTKLVFKRSLAILAITFLLNLFWMLPNFYYIKNHGLEVANSKIHSSFSDEAFLQSQNYGDFYDLALQKNFLFNWKAFNYRENKFTDLMSPWKNHLKQSYVEPIGMALFGLSVLGLVIAVIKKEKYLVAFIIPAMLSVIFWFNANGPLTSVFEYLRNNSILFREGLRFPFTKFSIILVMIMSLYIGFGLHVILRGLHKVKVGYLAGIVVFAGILCFGLPAFSGNFIADNVKVSIPNDYFQAFGWFNSIDLTARIAKLPLNTMWGWNYYSWHYEGAGFTWFGLPQPTFDREFDRWSHFNEDFYREASFAVYAKDVNSFEKTLQKYQVKYLFLDESVITPGVTGDSAGVVATKNLLSESDNIKQVAKFGFITIYDTGLMPPENYLSTPHAVRLDANLNYADLDPIYKNFGNYVEDGLFPSYPFVNFDKLGDVKEYLSSGNLIFENTKTGDKVSATVAPPIREDLSINRGFSEAYNCDLEKLGSVEKIRTPQSVTYKAIGNGVACDYLNYEDLAYNQAYVLHLAGENQTGRGLKIYLYNQATTKMDLEEVFPRGKFDRFFFIYPKNIEGSGYTLNFETRSYGRVASENTLSLVEFYPVDYSLLSNFVGRGDIPQTIPGELKIGNSHKYGTWAYKVDVQGSGLIQLGQGYEDGWVAIKINKGELRNKNYKNAIEILEHVRVNSWANGWVVPSGQLSPFTIYLFFWPQLLEWAGMGLGICALVILAFGRQGQRV